VNLSPRNNLVLGFVLDKAAAKGLEQLALKRGWLILYNATADQAAQEVRRFKPQVVIVQFSIHLGEALEVIDILRTRWPRTPLIAVTSLHNDDIERAIRGAGASCYLSGKAWDDLLDQAVAAMATKGSSMAKAE